MKNVTLTPAQKDLFMKRQDLRFAYVDVGTRIAKNHMNQNDEAYLDLLKEQTQLAAQLEATPSIVAVVEVGLRGPDGMWEDLYTEKYQSTAYDPIADAVARWTVNHINAVKLCYGSPEARVVEVYESRNDR